MPRPSNSPAGAAASALALLALVVAAPPALAEKADRDKPVNVEADRMVVDEGRRETVFEGNVVLTQGSLQLRGDRLTVRQDAEGFQYGTAWGRPATFRQKRDGRDEYIDGYAERLEYDGRKEQLQMFTTARLVKGQDEVRGDYITYNARTEFFQVVGGGRPAASPDNPEGRVRAVIQPKPRQPAPPQAPANLRPSTSTER